MEVLAPTLHNKMDQVTQNMNQTCPQEYNSAIRNLAIKKPRIFSENMSKLRKPFLCNEECSSSQIWKSNNKTEELKDTGIKQGIKQNISSADPSNIVDLDEEMKHSSSVENNLEENIQRHFRQQCRTLEIYNDNDKIRTFKENLNKRLNFGHFINKGETSAISDYFTDDSGNRTNFLESDTSIENFSFSDRLKPLKNSTFIIQGEANKYDTSYRKTNKTFIFEEKKCNNMEIKKVEEKTDTEALLDFIQINSYVTRSLEVPLITVNEKILNSKSLEKKENKATSRLEYGQNKTPKTGTIQLELFKQIEAKDKVMSQLLELSQSSEFPQLKHSCYIDCQKDNEGVCKQLKRFKNGANSREEHGEKGVLKYIWSTIKFPFAPVSPTTQLKIAKIVRKNPVTKAYMQLTNKNNKSKLENYEYETNKRETNPKTISDSVWDDQNNALNKFKPRKKCHLFRTKKN